MLAVTSPSILERAKSWWREKVILEIPVVKQLLQQYNWTGVKAAIKCVFSFIASTIAMQKFDSTPHAIHANANTAVTYADYTLLTLQGALEMAVFMTASTISFNVADTILTESYRGTLLFMHKCKHYRAANDHQDDAIEEGSHLVSTTPAPA